MFIQLLRIYFRVTSIFDDQAGLFRCICHALRYDPTHMANDKKHEVLRGKSFRSKPLTQEDISVWGQ